MTWGEIFNFLSITLDAIVSALGVALQAIAQAALANVHAAEWVLALVLAGTGAALAGRRGSSVPILLVFVLAVGASSWLSWKTGHAGMLAQQAVLAGFCVYGLMGRGGHRAAARKAGAA